MKELEQSPASPTTTTGNPPHVGRLFVPANRLLLIATVVLLTVLAVWLQFTPSGLLGKADAVGYAVCHRITVRSFAFPDGRQLPLCARCSGTFLGVLVGLLGPGLLLRRRHAAGFPPTLILAVMLGMSALWAFDGANSFAHLLPERVPRLYAPSNFLRLTTGMFHGITMGGLMLPIANATLWADASNEAAIARWWHLLVLYGIGALLIGLVLTGWGVFLYPLGLLSAVGTVSILAVINVVMVTTILRRENSAHTLSEALPLIFLGLAATFVIIGSIDAVRYAMFGTWDGFTIPGA